MTERDYRTRQLPQQEQPVVPETVPRTIENDRQGMPLWLKRAIGGGVLTAVLAGGITAGVEAFGGHKNPKEGQGPVATATANPGETASAAPSTAETTPATPEITADGYTFRDSQGNTYKGQTAFVEALKKQFEGTDRLKVGKHNVPAMLNEWVNSGLNEQEIAQDGMYNMEQVVALYDSAYSTAMMGTAYSTLGEDMKALHEQALTGYAWTHSQEQNKQDYKMEITMNSDDAWTGLTVGDTTHFNVTLTATETYSKSTGKNTSQDFPRGFDVTSQSDGTDVISIWGPRATA